MHVSYIHVLYHLERQPHGMYILTTVLLFSVSFLNPCKENRYNIDTHMQHHMHELSHLLRLIEYVTVKETLYRLL